MKALLIIAQKGFRDEELFQTKEELEKAGVTVHVASLSTETALGMMGGRYAPDLAVKNVQIEDYSAVVVIGGPGSPQLANHKEVIDLLKTAHEKKKLIAAICLGPMVLAKADILRGKRATVWTSSAFPQSVKALDAGGAKYEAKEKIVNDVKLITAFGPDQAREFGKAIAFKLKELKGGA